MRLTFRHIFLILSCGIISAQSGVGTTTPINKFQVETTTADPASSGSASNGNLRLSGTSGSHVLDFGLSSSSTFSWIQARSKSAYGTNYNLLLNPNGGNVGIGTSNPTAKLNIVGGGVRIFSGIGNNVSRPAINTTVIGNYEIRGVGSAGTASQADGGDDGFLRLSAGGGTNSNTQASIDISGFSSVADMNSNVLFRTTGVERMRIDNSGKVGIGTLNPSTTLTVGMSDGTVSGEITLNPSNSANEGGQLTFKKSITNSTYDWTIDQVGDATSPRFRIFPGGAETNGIVIKENGYVGIGNANPTTKLYVNGDITANSVAGTSDARYKTNIKPVTGALEKVKALQGVYFNWNQKAFPQKEFGNQVELGFIAQEVEKIVPEVVTKEINNEEYRAVKYDKVVALLVEAIKEQQKQIDELQKKVKELSKEKLNK